ncbi:MAG TPA: O-antigen ligase family protein [Candidatus Aminicenantes bacterium]|nr:O-antigen ligase family protein [Candidatus Aminicenantes bacterium]HRY64453.1 O-antigen ligase family protein [Candidatus Aminicenantes bacterium]
MKKKILDYGLLTLLLWSPLPAASVEEWAIFTIELLAAVLAGAYILLEPKPGLNPHLPPVVRKMRPVAAAFFGFLVLQVVPLPAGLVRLLSPASYGFRKLYAPGFDGMKFMTLSISPGQTIAAGLFLAALFILGALVLRTVVRGRQIRTMLAVLAGSGVFQALYGLFELSRNDPRILFYRKLFSPESVTGTFVNRNHFSGYLEMIVPLALGLALARMNMMTFGVKGFREKLMLWTSKGILTNVLILGAVVVMSLAVVLSNSRSGVVVLGFTVFLFLGLSVTAFSRTGFRQPWVGKTVRWTFLCFTVLAAAVGVGSTIRRFSVDTLIREDRPQYWANTVAIIGDFPLFGTGLGTFASAYGAYEKSASSELLLTHAHNDFLEYAAELGLVGFVLLAGGVLYLAVSAFLAWRKRRNPQARALALGGLVSLAGAGLHAVTDFNLHIPANMVLFAAVLGLTLVMAYYRKT